MSRGKHLIGRVIASCVLEKVLGYGGSSAVFLAQQHNPERKVAVKVFLPRADMDSKMQSEFQRRFLHEAKAASKLDHPNILSVYAYGEQNGFPYIVMPYMPGGTLSEYIAKHGPLSLLETQWYLEQIASALDYAHLHGCIHCDVKPANILLDSDGRAILSDFGIARLIHPADNTTQATAKNPETLMGTPDYISPEQALGRAVDGRSDVYSLGITLFYLLSKRLPFVADSMLALALLHVHEAPPSLALIRVDISPMLDRVVHKALAKEPSQRFQTAGELATAFTQAITSSNKMPAHIGKPVAILNTNANYTSSTAQSILVASEPLIQVKPFHTSSFARSRLAAIVTLLLLLALIMGYTVSLIAAHFPHPATARVLSPITVKPVTTHLDYLTDHAKWPRSKTFFYDSQSYHVLNNSTQNVALALYNDNQFSTFKLMVTMSQLRNAITHADYYGIVFRSNSNQSHYYLFEVINSVHAQYVFSRYDSGQWSTIASGAAPSLIPGLRQGNTVAINASGNNFTFAINNQVVAKPISDLSKAPLRSGLIGLYVEEQGAEVAFSHLYITPQK